VGVSTLCGDDLDDSSDGGGNFVASVRHHTCHLRASCPASLLLYVVAGSISAQQEAYGALVVLHCPSSSDIELMTGIALLH
jgi:hypothetical protein